MRAATTGNGLGPSIAPTVDADNPWPGPEAFREADQQFFFGRDIACRSLTRLVLQSRLTILYGRSGLGKTSLLRAGLFPRLRDTSSLPVYVRLSWDEGLSLTARGLRVQVKRAIEQATADHHIDGPVLADDQTLWEWFFRSEEWFFTERSHRVRPVLVFDQFEEIFTHGRSSPSVSAAASQFLEELVDLVRGSMPTTVAERLASDATGVRTFDPGGDPCGVLIALRQEFLADLLRLRPRLPSLLDHRFELSAMSTDAAERVITGPGSHLVASGVERNIVAFVAAARRGTEDQQTDTTTVDPAILSIFCREMNDTRRRRGLPTITAALVEGEQDAIIATFYKRSIADLKPDARQFLERRLVTASGYRDSVSLDEAVHAPGMSKDIVDVLIERRLIRPEGGGQRVRLELSHDVLLDPVVGARQMREGREREAAAWRKTFWLFFAMGIAAVVGFGLYQRNRAIEARNALEAAELLKQSDALASSPLSLDRSYLLAIRALRMSPSADAVQRVKDIGRASDDSLPPPLVRLSRPGGPVRSIAVNKPGTHLATRSTTHEACLWALRSGQLVATLRHDGRVNAVGFSIDGSQLATGGADGRVKLWTLAGQETASLREGSPINSIAFAPARARLAVTADSGRVGVWDISTPSRPREVASVRHEAAAHLVAFNQDASLLASAGDDGIRLWRIEPTGAMKAVGRVPQRTTPRTLQFVTLDHELFPRDRWAGWPQSEVLLVTDLGAAAHVWGVPRQGVAEPREWPSQVYFLGAPLLMAGDTGDLLDVLKEAEERRLRLGAAPPGAAGDAAISLFWSGRDLWALDSNGVARKWMGDAALSVRTTSRIRALTTTLVQPERVPLTAAAAYESGSRYIVTGNALGTTLVWAPEERRLGQWAIATVSANGARAAGLDRGAFSADPFPIVPPRRRNPRSLWSYLVWRDSPFDSPDRPFPEPPRLNDGTLAFNLSDDGSILAVATNDGGAIWRFAQGNSGRFTHFTREEKRRSGLDRGFEPYQAIHVEVGAQTLLIATGASIELRSVSDGHLLWSKSIARLQGARLSPNGGEVAVWTPDRVMLVKGSDAEQPFGVTGRVRTASFDPAGKRLAVCVDSGTAALFDVSTGGWLRSFDVGSPCQTIAFDHSGARLAVGAQNGIAHVFDENASKAGTPLPMNAPVSALAFSSDGAALVAGSDDHVVHVWDLQTAKELARTTAAGDIIEQVGFSQDATRVFALGPFGLVSEVWQSRDVLAEACAAVRGRSRDSRRRYLADEQDVLAACPSTF